MDKITSQVVLLVAFITVVVAYVVLAIWDVADLHTLQDVMVALVGALAGVSIPQTFTKS